MITTTKRYLKFDYKNWFRNCIEYFFGSFITYRFRPKLASDIDTRADSLKNDKAVAIIIQGPLMKKDEFTLNTIRIYKKLFRNCKIILSTWTDEDSSYIDQIRDEDVEVILNDKPKYAGIANVNFQITSTLNAVIRAKELGVDYVLKTRTDLRLYNPNSIEFLTNLLEVFPAKNERGQNKRIAFPSLNTFKYRPYSLTDLVIFGDIDDMLNYTDTEHDKRNELPTDGSIGSWSKARMGETYLSTNYLEKIGWQLKWTMADSWQSYADCFCIFDSQSLDIYWNKYDRNKEYRRLRYTEMRNDQELSFDEWLNLFIGYKNKKIIPEYILSDKFTKQISGQI